MLIFVHITLLKQYSHSKMRKKIHYKTIVKKKHLFIQGQHLVMIMYVKTAAVSIKPVKVFTGSIHTVDVVYDIY